MQIMHLLLNLYPIDRNRQLGRVQMGSTIWLTFSPTMTEEPPPHPPFFLSKPRWIGKRSQPGIGDEQIWAGCANKANGKLITCYTSGSMKQKGLLWETWGPQRNNLEHLINDRKEVIMSPSPGTEGQQGTPEATSNYIFNISASCLRKRVCA